MSNAVVAFAPLPRTTISLPYTASSARVQLPAAVVAAIAGGACPQYQVLNAGTGPVFVNDGDVTVVAVLPNGATPGDTGIAAGVAQILSFANGNPGYIAAIAPAAGTGTLYISFGTGQ